MEQLRDDFARSAMSALIIARTAEWFDGHAPKWCAIDFVKSRLAEMSFDIADRMIDERTERYG